MDVVYIDFFHNNNYTIHPYLSYINDHEISLKNKYYNDNYGNEYNYLYQENSFKNNHIRWITFKSFNLKNNNRIGIPQKNLYININNYNLIISINLHLFEYKNFDIYLNNISKNIKRDYLRALEGEKNRNIEIFDKNIIKQYLNEYFISIKNNTNIDIYLNNYYNIKKKRKPIYYGLYLMLDDLKNLGINKEYIKLSDYIRIKLSFKIIDNIFLYINDINEMIMELNKYYNTNGYTKYNDLFNNSKNKIKNNSDLYHHIKYYGVFHFNKLTSFISIAFDGEMCGICVFLHNPIYNKYSHNSFLLISIIKDIYENYKHIKIINYWINNCQGQLNLFKWKQRFLFKESCILGNNII